LLEAITEAVAWLSDFGFRRRSMRWTRDMLEQQQSRRFRQLVKFAAQRSPYYQSLFAQHRLDPKTVQLADIPALTKRDLTENFDRICTVPAANANRIAQFIAANPDPTQLLDGKYYVIRSSGTSGPPSHMAFSVREWIRGCSLQMRQTPGLQWRRRLAFVGATAGHFAGVSLALTGRRGLNRLFMNCRVLDHNLPVESMVESLNEFQPQILSAYANLHAALAQQAILGRMTIRPRYIVSSGEPLRPSLRQLLEETYRAKVIDLYCSSETLLVAGGSSVNGLMLYEEDNLLEPFADHCLVTNLFNRTIPLIRYQMNDVLQSCESQQQDAPFRWIKGVAGRREESFDLTNNDGDLEPIGPLSILYLPIPQVPGLQLVVISPTNLVFRILIPPETPAFDRAKILRDTKLGIQDWLKRKRMDHHVRFEVVGVSNLEVDAKSAKTKLIIRPSEPTIRLRAA
jgi:phenylacetate-CoA ligase